MGLFGNKTTALETSISNKPLDSILDIGSLDTRHVYYFLKMVKIRKERPYLFREVTWTLPIILLLRNTSVLERAAIEMCITHDRGHLSLITDIDLDPGTTWKQYGEILGSWGRQIFVSGFTAEDTKQICYGSECPVVNCSSDESNPINAISDIFTILEAFDWNVRGMKLAWIGNFGSIANDLIITAIMVGINVVIAIPEKISLKSSILEKVRSVSSLTGAKLIISHDPLEAIRGANIVATAPWYDSYYYKPTTDDLQRFEGYQVNAKLCSLAANNWVFLHRMGHGDEVTDEVYSGDNSLTIQQQKNVVYVANCFVYDLPRKLITPSKSFC